MSLFGDVIDALETKVKAVVTLPVGDLGWERGLRLHDKLESAARPHVFAHNPDGEEAELRYGQRLTTVSVQLDYWAWDQTQEQMATTVDAIREQIRQDQTLGGVVDFARVLRWHVVELPDKPEKAGVLVVLAEKNA